ncbi:MAG: hypothetical protein FWG82_04820 [Oscillospiraceae bacterium]|nr:hypothetical protein [Oscillospiraceae bacterium]
MKKKTKTLKIIAIALAAVMALSFVMVAGIAGKAQKVAHPIQDERYFDRTGSGEYSKFGVWAYWVLSCTWGVFATAAGGVKALSCMMDGLEPKYFKGNIYFENVREMGSNNLGPFFFLGENAEYYTPYHEAGHGLQNIVMGPVYPIVVGISSEIWYQKFVSEYAEELASGAWDPDARRSAYDRNPIERWATSWGARVYGLELE